MSIDGQIITKLNNNKLLLKHVKRLQN